MLADGWSQWASALLTALAILVAHYLWVIRSDAAFEETAAAAALARSRTRSPARRAPQFTARRVPPLAPHGWPAGALLWKNVVAVVRAGRARGVAVGMMVAALVLLGLSAVGGNSALLELVGWMTAMWAGFLFVLGPQWIRNDLRTDLARLAVLRSYPLRGAAVVGAETAGSTAILTALQLGLVLLAWIAFWGGSVDEPRAEVRTAVLLGAVVLLPGINFLAMLIQNGAVVLLPGWVNPGSDRPIGVEALETQHAHHLRIPARARGAPGCAYRGGWRGALWSALHRLVGRGARGACRDGPDGARSAHPAGTARPRV